MYGVYVEYPPDYDFNIGGTGLHGWGVAADAAKEAGEQQRGASAARTDSHATASAGGHARSRSSRSLQAPTDQMLSHSAFEPKSASEVVQPAFMLAGRPFQDRYSSAS